MALDSLIQADDALTQSACCAAAPGLKGCLLTTEPSLSPPQASPLERHAAPRFYRPELDFLRLGAFLMVWTDHALIPFAGLLPANLLALVEGAGSCGVPIFFFLSAYLITELLRREQTTTGSVHLGHFYLRRILRIWPLYFGVLGAYAVLGLRFHGFRIEPERLIASSLLAGNWYIALHPTITTPMRALWSISVEEQWYLISPLLLIKLRTGSLLVLCALTVISSCLLLSSLAHHSAQDQLHVTAWVNSGVEFQYFALGAGAALFLQGRMLQSHWLFRVVLLGAGVAAIMSASGACHIRQAGTGHTAAALISGYLLAGIGAACLFLALLGTSPRHYPPVLVRLGQLSFGLYVFHETAFFLTDAVFRRFGLKADLLLLTGNKLIALGLTALLALASYHFWELPFLRLKRRWTYVRTREAV